MSAQTLPALATARIDHVGSFLRPQELKRAIADFEESKTTAADLRVAEDDAIRNVIARQEAIGFPFVNDGEYRRSNFQDSFTESVSGYPDGQRSNVARRPLVEQLHLVRNLPLAEYELTTNMTSKPVKMTLVSADRLIQRVDVQGSRSVYPGGDELVADIVAIERQIVAELVAAGCRYIQIDAPGYTAYVDPDQVAAMRSRGEDPEENLARSIAADNAIIRDFPDVTFGIHLCRGNSDASLPQPRQGHYDAIAEQLFNQLDHHRFLLEYDQERHGSFEPLRLVPKEKTIVLGLVSTKLRPIEESDDLKRRIEEASSFVPLEQLALSPQCGFASQMHQGPNRLTDEEQWGKLERIKRVADEVWG